MLQPLLTHPDCCADAVAQLAPVRSLQGRTEEAVALYRAVVQLGVRTPQAHTNLGMALLAAGEWGEGWAHYEVRRAINPQRSNVPWPQWNGENLAGRKILLSCEQGLGDLIQFVRFAEDIASRGAAVWVHCSEQAEPLLATHPAVAGCVMRPPFPNFDYHSCVVSLPRILGLTRENVPCKSPTCPPARSDATSGVLVCLDVEPSGSVWCGVAVRASFAINGVRWIWRF